MSNEEQISEKEEQKKNKSWADCPPTDHQKSIQTEDSEWTLMANNKRKNIQRPLMEDLYIGNLTTDTTEEEILAPLGLDGTTHLSENSLARRQYTDNGRFAGCIHVRMPQQFIETVLELNGLSFKNRDPVIQPLTEMMKLQQSRKRNNYTSHGGLSLRAKQRGKGRGNGYSRGTGQASRRQKNSQQQPRPNGQIPPRQGDKTGPFNPPEGAPGEQVGFDNVEAPASAKTLRGEDTLTLAQRIRLNQERERAANCEQRRLILELSCDKETIPAKLIPDATLVYMILQEKIAVETKSQHSFITAILATNPPKP